MAHGPQPTAPRPCHARAERDSHADNLAALEVRIRTLREGGRADVGEADFA